MVPERDSICHSHSARYRFEPSGHIPDGGTVEHDVRPGQLEAQFATCLNCLEPIARFRLLDGTQSWFDQWGIIVTDSIPSE